MAAVAMSPGPLPDAGWDVDGYVPVRGAADQAACAALLARGASGPPDDDPTVAALAAEVVAGLLGGPVTVESCRVVMSLPGASGTPWGRANGRGRGRGRTALAVVALTPATVATGCPWVVAGSHRDATARPPGLPVDGAAAVPLAAGDALVADGGLLQRVTGNHSVDTAAALVVVFHRTGG
jgi:ectoine hydroxylase-related dioxygenase (phytanoyl-CoA dioxygenase family)